MNIYLDPDEKGMGKKFRKKGAVLRVLHVGRIDGVQKVPTLLDEVHRLIELRGLRAFLDDYPMATAFVLYGGVEVRYFEGITVIPIEQALFRLPELLGAEQEVENG